MSFMKGKKVFAQKGGDARIAQTRGTVAETGISWHPSSGHRSRRGPLILRGLRNQAAKSSTNPIDCRESLAQLFLEGTGRITAVNKPKKEVENGHCSKTL